MSGSAADDLLGPLLATFAVEAAEHLQAMNRHLLSLERGERDPQLGAELFREAHSLKGAARAVNLLEVEGLAHELEDTFAGLSSPSGEPGPGALDTAYRTLDALATLVAAGTAGVPADPPGSRSPAGWPPTGGRPTGVDRPDLDQTGIVPSAGWQAAPPPSWTH